jgi:tungstate transport system substrate-binding protein
LRNPYGIIAVDPKKHPHVNSAAARRYIEWITSPETQAMIGNYKISGKVLFHPNPQDASALP